MKKLYYIVKFQGIWDDDHLHADRYVWITNTGDILACENKVVFQESGEVDYLTLGEYLELFDIDEEGTACASVEDLLYKSIIPNLKRLGKEGRLFELPGVEELNYTETPHNPAAWFDVPHSMGFILKDTHCVDILPCPSDRMN